MKNLFDCLADGFNQDVSLLAWMSVALSIFTLCYLVLPKNMEENILGSIYLVAAIIFSHIITVAFYCE